MNIFTNKVVAQAYDTYYETQEGQKTDRIEKAIIEELLQNIPYCSMLEIGCGTGHWSKWFAEKKAKITAVDNAETMLSIAQSKDIEANFICASAEDLPFTKESFPFVFAMTMLEFVQSQQKVVKEVHRILEKDGYFLLGCLNGNSYLARTKKNSSIFANANFLTIETLHRLLSPFQHRETRIGLYQNPVGTIFEENSTNHQTIPTFIAMLVQKIE